MSEFIHQAHRARVQDVLDLAAQNAGRSMTVWLTVIDFEDAFYSVGLLPSEWPYLCARHPAGGVFNFRTALCGGAACPLVWGRAAPGLSGGPATKLCWQLSELQ